MQLRSTAACLAAAALAVGLAACASSSGSSGGSAAAGGTLTIQGDTGSPALVENFNPFQAATEMQNPALDDQGRIVERGPTKQVLQHPRHSYTIQLLDAVANPFASPATKGTS